MTEVNKLYAKLMFMLAGVIESATEKVDSVLDNTHCTSDKNRL